MCACKCARNYLYLIIKAYIIYVYFYKSVPVSLEARLSLLMFVSHDENEFISHRCIPNGRHIVPNFTHLLPTPQSHAYCFMPLFFLVLPTDISHHHAFFDTHGSHLSLCLFLSPSFFSSFLLCFRSSDSDTPSLETTRWRLDNLYYGLHDVRLTGKRIHFYIRFASWTETKIPTLVGKIFRTGKWKRISFNFSYYWTFMNSKKEEKS